MHVVQQHLQSLERCRIPFHPIHFFLCLYHNINILFLIVEIISKINIKNDQNLMSLQSW